MIAPVTLTIKRSKQTKRFTLRIDPREGGLKVSAPLHAEDFDILAFVRKHHGWAEKQLSKQPEIGALKVGVKIPIGGKPHRLAHTGKLRGLPMCCMMAKMPY